MNQTVVDVGYFQVKALSDSGNKILFPSVVSSSIGDLTGGLFKRNMGYKVKIKTLSGEQESLVGEAAMNSTTAISTQTRRKAPEVHDILVITAAILTGAAGPTSLGVGLPLAYYLDQRDELAARLSEFKGHVKINDEAEKYISFPKVSVFPQGASICLANGVNHNKKGKTAIIDIGYGTTDFMLFEDLNGSPVPLLEFCGSIDVGIQSVERAVASAYQELTGAIPPKFILNDVLGNGRILYSGKEINLAPHLTAACQRTALKVTEDIKANWGKTADAISLTILAGGGAKMLYQYFDTFINLVTPEDPLFANAEGFMALMPSIDDDLLDEMQAN